MERYLTGDIDAPGSHQTEAALSQGPAQRLPRGRLRVHHPLIRGVALVSVFLTDPWYIVNRHSASSVTQREYVTPVLCHTLQSPASYAGCDCHRPTVTVTFGWIFCF